MAPEVALHAVARRRRTAGSRERQGDTGGRNQERRRQRDGALLLPPGPVAVPCRFRWPYSPRGGVEASGSNSAGTALHVSHYSGKLLAPPSGTVAVAGATTGAGSRRRRPNRSSLRGRKAYCFATCRIADVARVRGRAGGHVRGNGYLGRGNELSDICAPPQTAMAPDTKGAEALAVIVIMSCPRRAGWASSW